MTSEEKLLVNSASSNTAPINAMGTYNNNSLLNNLFAAATRQQFLSDLFNIGASSNTRPEQLLNNLLTPEALEKFNSTVNNSVNGTNTNDDLSMLSSASNANLLNNDNLNGEAISQELIKLITSGQPTSESMLKMVIII